jgi:hypothetical protein
MTPHITYEDHNLGDNLVFLHLLRALAKANPGRVFYHFTHSRHLPQLNEVIQNLDNVVLFSFESDQWEENKRRAINVWKNVGGTGKNDGFWERSPNRWNWSAFTLEHHHHIAGRMRLRSPMTVRENLLFDYPALNPHNIGGSYFYDFLFVNGEPCSGQFSPMKKHGSGYLDDFIKKIAKRFSVITTDPVAGVECTRDRKESITDIGRLSLMCRNHIMIATGPMWATLNTTNHHHSAGRKRIVLLDNGEDLNMPGITQRASLAEVEKIAKQEGWI